jgi:hypothetical protein
VQRFFRRKRVATLQELERVLGTSGRTVLRALESERYLTSYNHAGKYYTLPHIPSFDEHGLWLHSEARFSKYGTLRKTVAVLITASAAGFTHEELVAILGVRVHNTLKSLIETGEIGRAHIAVNYVYVAADPTTALGQLSQRDLMGEPARIPLPVVPPPLELGRVVEVLVAVIHSPRDNAKRIAAHLVARGVEISQAQVEQVFETYEIGKKKAASRSRRSRS